jgi:hypothetical protein
LQLPQGIDMNPGGFCQPRRATHGAIEHPLRNLQMSQLRLVGPATTKERLPGFVQGFMDDHPQVEPRMPGIGEIA